MYIASLCNLVIYPKSSVKNLKGKIETKQIEIHEKKGNIIKGRKEV